MNYALSLKQPWAYVLASGGKSIEIRRWNTSYRGILYIHASKTPDTVSMEYFDLKNVEKKFKYGHIIGLGILVDVISYNTQEEFISDRTKHLNPDDWFNGNCYGFIFKDLHLLKESIPYKGKLKIFEMK